MAFVYWIHLPEHTDVTKDGYVGFTSKTVEDRFKAHKESMSEQKLSHYILYKTMKKYKNEIVITTLVEGSSEYCLSIEGKLRPAQRIGWNMVCGGSAAMLGFKHSDETKKLISKATKGRVLSEAHKSAIGRAHTGQKRSAETIAKLCEVQKRRVEKDKILGKPKWRQPRANLEVWANSIELFHLFQEHNKCGVVRLANASGAFTKDQLRSMHREFQAGWCPDKDDLFLSWLLANNKDKNG
jgi:hypothetical protein